MIKEAKLVVYQMHELLGVITAPPAKQQSPVGLSVNNKVCQSNLHSYDTWYLPTKLSSLPCILSFLLDCAARYCGKCLKHSLYSLVPYSIDDIVQMMNF